MSNYKDQMNSTFMFSNANVNLGLNYQGSSRTVSKFDNSFMDYNTSTIGASNIQQK